MRTVHIRPSCDEVNTYVQMCVSYVFSACNSLFPSRSLRSPRLAGAASRAVRSSPGSHKFSGQLPAHQQIQEPEYRTTYRPSYPQYQTPPTDPTPHVVSPSATGAVREVRSRLDVEQEGGVFRDKCCAFNSMHKGALLHVTKKLMKWKSDNTKKVKMEKW